MRLCRKIQLAPLLALLAVALSQPAAAHSGPADKGRVADSGVFGVFVNGQRVASESFQIHEGTTHVASSEIKAENAAGKSAQRAELQFTPAGELRRYEWHEVSPGRAHIVVEPLDQFLVEHITPNPPDKPIEHPFLVPPTAMVLDDYFFSQREVLAWRYLAQACPQGLAQCRPAKAQFGVLVPQQRTSLIVTLEYAGPEKVTIRGKEQELNRLNLKSDDGEWALYLDGALKLIRIVIPAEKTEVLRDY